MARPHTPLLSKDSIRDTALSLIDAQGLEELSMRSLAQELGVKAQSLYTHYASKMAILDAVANLLTKDIDTTGFDAGGWEVGLQVWGKSYRAALAAHPNAAPVVAAGTGEHKDFLAMADAVHGGLTSAGWPPRHATLIAGAVKYLVIGAATTSFGGGFADDTQVYLDRYPNLHQAHLIRRQAVEIDQDSFELALSSLTKGLGPLFDALTTQ